MASVLNPINFVTGTLGSGKSYYAMRNVFRYLAAGKVVATNFDLVGPFWETARRMSKSGRRVQGRAAYEWCDDCRGRALRYDVMDDLYDYELPGSGEDRGLLVFDEGGLNLNRRTQRYRQKRAEHIYDNPLKDLQHYINMRKLGWTCLILAHSAKHLDDQVQDLGGSVIRLRNFARVKMPLIGVSLTKQPRFLAIHYWPEVRAITKRELYGLNIKVARHYKSMELFDYLPEGAGRRHHQAPGPLGVLVAEDCAVWNSRRLDGGEDAPRAAERARSARSPGGSDGDPGGVAPGSLLDEWYGARVGSEGMP